MHSVSPNSELRATKRYGSRSLVGSSLLRCEMKKVNFCSVVAAVFLFAGFTVELFAQNTAVLRGQVMDELGAVIPGARLTLVAADGKKRNVTSKADGEFAVANLAPGDYT